MPIAAGRREWISRHSNAGNANVGNPPGNLPTTAIPWSSKRKDTEATLATMQTTSAEGIFGANRRRASKSMSNAAPKSIVGAWASWSLPAASNRRGKKSLFLRETPSKPPSWEATRISAAPVM